jgi:uncharacterized membrane protein (UPF0182 family)
MITAISRTASQHRPFLEYDRDPYMVLADGELFWIQDAYDQQQLPIFKAVE